MSDIVYVPSSAGIDLLRFSIGRRHEFRDDEVATMTVDDLTRLASSDDWEDRVRAEHLRTTLRFALPDGFPCIYETVDSPNRSGIKDPRPEPWVKSPDEDMLRELLPLYQELWDSYTAQWGSGSRRTFAVGHLNDVSPHGTYRPGATPSDVLLSTVLTHKGMRRDMPDRVRRIYETRFNRS